MNSEIFFSALNNPIRLRLLMLIAAHGELCVCELTHALELSQPAISRHLALLRQGGVIEDRRQAQWVYYQLANKTPQWTREVLAATMKGNANQEPFVGDNALLESMPNRPEAMQCC